MGSLTLHFGPHAKHKPVETVEQQGQSIKIPQKKTHQKNNTNITHRKEPSEAVTKGMSETFCFMATLAKGSEEEARKDIRRRVEVPATFKMCDSEAAVCNLPSAVIFLSLFVCAHYKYFPLFFSTSLPVAQQSPCAITRSANMELFSRPSACGPPPYNVIKDWRNANRCLEMV